jgi:cytidylate kinase
LERQRRHTDSIGVRVTGGDTQRTCGGDFESPTLVVEKVLPAPFHRTSIVHAVQCPLAAHSKDRILATENPRSNQDTILIAIDGPAGAGKSTVASSLAKRLGVPYLDTGAMYRAVALLALRDGIEMPLDESSAARVLDLMERTHLDVAVTGDGTTILLDGQDVSAEIRTPECSLMASAVSALSEVRKALVPIQRELGLAKGGVMEGRDIGTVVLPDADLKIFLTASVEERARRRHRDLQETDPSVILEDVQEQQQMRDRQDTSRSASPLQVARGSIVVDTTGSTLEEVVDRLFEEVARIR